MPGYAAFLRAINLGRNRRVSGAELRSLFEDMGFDDVASFRTSGNVVFRAGREPPAELAARIEEKMASTFGYDVGVFLRSATEVRAIAKSKPFDDSLVEASDGKLQVALLSSRPVAGTREKVQAIATDDDRLAFGDRELYWLPSGGTQDSALDAKAIEKLLGSSTMRTKGTIEVLAAKFFG